MTPREQYETAYRLLRQQGRGRSSAALVVAVTAHRVPVHIARAARTSYEARRVADTYATLRLLRALDARTAARRLARLRAQHVPIVQEVS